MIGGPVPVNANFCLAATIEKDPAKMQAFTNAAWRATQWIKANSPENILGTIEPLRRQDLARTPTCSRSAS